MPEWMLCIFVGMFGLCMGSFFNVVICRLPKGESVCSPPSHCPSCGRSIKCYDNIPVLSYVLLRGRCRSCGVHISARYLMVELLTGGLFVAVFLQSGLTPQLGVDLLFISLLINIAFIDLDTFLIPDVLSLTGIVLGFLSSFMSIRVSWPESLMGILIGGGALYAVASLYRLLRKQDGMGGGDIKLLAMIGAFIGALGVVFTIVAASLVGTIVGLAFMRKSEKNIAGTMIPFGPFLSLGAVIFYLWGEELLDMYLSLF